MYFGGEKVCTNSIYYRAEVIDPSSRTFEIKAKLPAETSLKSGTLCDLEIVLAERKGLGVTSDAVLPGRDGRMSIFLNEGGVAKASDVRCGLTTGGFTEILSPEPLVGKDVIVKGQAFVREGDKLEVERLARVAMPPFPAVILNPFFRGFTTAAVTQTREDA